MQIPKHWRITKEIAKLNTEIEVLLEFFVDRSLAYQLEKNILARSILHSSLYSARIENNPLRLEEIDIYSENEKQIEIRNLQRAYQVIFLTKKKLALSVDNLLLLHNVVCDRLSPETGKLRTDASAIYDQFGTLVYLAPPPAQVKAHIELLLSYLNSETDDEFLLCKAFLAHYHLEKIHPFIDGNGRMGRLLISWFLTSKNTKLTRAVTFVFEEYLSVEKDQYYYFLKQGEQKIEDYLLFMLEGMKRQLRHAKREFEVLSSSDDPILPARQAEIFQILRDHQQMSLDQISRRFLRVPLRTLRYDLRSLCQKNLIQKIGTTRGAQYAFRSQIK